MRIQLKPIADQRMVIVGASSGMGLATARRAAEQGARVLLVARDGDALARICDDITAEGGQAAFLTMDATEPEYASRVVQVAHELYGGFDTWVNVTGVGLIGTLKDIAMDDHRRLFETNYWSCVHGALAAVEHFRATGQHGAVVNVGSLASDMPFPYGTTYMATKHAMKAFSHGLRIELMQEGLPVSVTLIKPSAIDTGFFPHGRTTLGAPLKAPPPQYHPRVVADAIIHAAQHPKRAIAVGALATFAPMLNSLAPAVNDRVTSLIPPRAMVEDQRPVADPDNLYDVPVEGEEQSGWYRPRTTSITTAVQTTHQRAAVAAAGVAAGVGVLDRKSVV